MITIEPGRVVYLNQREVAMECWKRRPFVVVGAVHSGYLIVPLTTKLRRPDLNVIIDSRGVNGLEVDSMAKCTNPVVVSGNAIWSVAGMISVDELDEIRRRLADSLLPLLGASA